MKISGVNYIGSKKSKNGDKTFTTFNPKLNVPNSWALHEATSDEIDEACKLAQEAFLVYKEFSGAKKAEFLRAIADEIENLGDELISVYTQESGLPEGRAIGERGRTMGQLKAFAALLEEGSWDKLP